MSAVFLIIGIVAGFVFAIIGLLCYLRQRGYYGLDDIPDRVHPTQNLTLFEQVADFQQYCNKMQKDHSVFPKRINISVSFSDGKVVEADLYQVFADIVKRPGSGNILLHSAMDEVLKKK